MTLTLLLVDDNEEILDFLSSVLESDYRILRANNGRQALELLTHEMVTLVISDVMMPVMDGYELCRCMKTSGEICHIPVILLTAKNTLQDRLEGLELGADAYIEKPFSVVHLKVQISNLLDNRNKLRAYFASTSFTSLNTVVHSSDDELFLENLSNYILGEIENTDLDIDQLADRVHMSRMTLYRKIKALSDMTPHEFIHVTRLKKSAELLSGKNYKIYEVAMMVGYKSQTHFGKVFQKQFGVSPSQFIQNRQVTSYKAS